MEQHTFELIRIVICEKHTIFVRNFPAILKQIIFLGFEKYILLKPNRKI
jgi:hypothetical protein